MVPIARPLIEKEEIAAVVAVLESGQLAQGSKVRRFEERFAEWCGVAHAVAVSSGTAALHLALLAHDIGAADEVITTPFSFVASANCVLFVGAQPRFADIEPAYFTIDPAAIARKITPSTRALVIVHLYGQPCNMDAILPLVREHNLVLIEDACQAHGATFHGKPVGSFGTGCFSFYPTKNMTTGEGGMITTNDPEIARRARLLREHGAPQRYVHEILGYNLRMTDLQAAIGLVQLDKIDGWNARRQANAATLTALLAGAPGVVAPTVRPNATHVFHQYTVRIPNRDGVAHGLAQRGIGTGIHYSTPIHRQPLYAPLGLGDGLREAEIACQNVLSLPVHPTVTEAELVEVARALRAEMELALAPVALEV